ncbi:MAG: Rid family detoxifying hydrolase [Minisyncoccia bacterium]
MKHYITSEETGIPFSQAVEANGFVFISGQVPLDENDVMVEGDMRMKTHRVLKNIELILTKVGLTWKHVVRMEVYLPDLNNLPEVNAAYAEYLKHPLPTRHAIGVKALPLNADIEITAIAVRE